MPRSDGQEAATIDQRLIIFKALKRAGYTMIIPQWFNKDLTPRNSYWKDKI